MAVEDQAQDYALRIMESGTRAVLETGEEAIGGVLHALGTGVKAAGGRMAETRHTGEVGAKTLQRDHDALQVVPLDVDGRTGVIRELRKTGIAFHLEHDRRAGKWYLHFDGRDAAEVEHAAAKISDRLNSRAERTERRTPKTRRETIDGIKQRGGERVRNARRETKRTLGKTHGKGARR